MDSDKAYPEQVAKRILARAVELDHIRSQNYSLADLRSIAAEVGVSEAALEQAMREQQPLAPVRAEIQTRRRIGMLVPMLTAGAAVLGLSGGLWDVRATLIASPLVISILLMLSGGLAVSQDYSNPRRGWHRFLISNTALWAAYGSCWLLAASTTGMPRSLIAMITLRIGIIGWGLTSAFGSVMAWLQRRPSSDADAGTVTPPLKRRIADTLKSWLDVWARRSAVKPITRTDTAHATSAH